MFPRVPTRYSITALSVMSEGPRVVRRLLAELADGRFLLQVRTVDSEDDRRRADIRAKLVATAIASVGFAVLVQATRGSLVLGVAPGEWLFGVLLVGSWVWLVRQWLSLR